MGESLKAVSLLMRVKGPLVALTMAAVGIAVALVLTPGGVMLTAATAVFVLLFAFQVCLAGATLWITYRSQNGPGRSALRKFAFAGFWAWLALAMFTICYHPSFAASSVGGFVVDTILGGALLWCLALSVVAAYEAFRAALVGEVEPDEVGNQGCSEEDCAELAQQRERVASRVTLPLVPPSRRDEGSRE